MCRLDGSTVPSQVSRLWVFQGLKRIDVEEVPAGDIAAVSGIEDLAIGETIADALNPKPLPPIRVEEPTMVVTFKVNDSPFSGRDGQYVVRHSASACTARPKDVSLRAEDTADPDSFKVRGRENFISASDGEHEA